MITPEILLSGSTLCVLFSICIFLILRKAYPTLSNIKRCIIFSFSGLFGVIILAINGPTLSAVKVMILFGILLFASISDIQTREVSDSIWIMIFILSFVGLESTNLTSMVIGAVSVFIPQMIVAITRPGSIGGADIKITTATAFLLGAENGVFALLIGLVLAIITMMGLHMVKRHDKENSFPLVPFLSIGIILSSFI